MTHHGDGRDWYGNNWTWWVGYLGHKPAISKQKITNWDSCPNVRPQIFTFSQFSGFKTNLMVFILIMMEYRKLIFFFKILWMGQLSHCHILVKLMVWHFCKLLQWQSLSHHFKSYISTKNVYQFFFQTFSNGTAVLLSHNRDNNGITFSRTVGQLSQKSNFGEIH